MGGEGGAHAWPLQWPSPSLAEGQDLPQLPPGLGLAVPVELVLLKAFLPLGPRSSLSAEGEGTTSTPVANAVALPSACH